MQKLLFLKYDLRAFGYNSGLLPQSVVADSIDSKDLEQQHAESDSWSDEKVSSTEE